PYLSRQMSPISPRRVLAFFILALPVTPIAAQNLKLNGPLARGVAGEITSPQASPDGKYVVYAADRDGDHFFELYSVMAKGRQAPVRLLGPVPEYLDAQITVDGAGVLLPFDLDGNGSDELVIVSIDGSAPPRSLSGPLAPSGSVNWFHQTTDGVHVVYISNQ